MKIDYTLWPNTDGQLGQNKVQIPDGVTTQWPEGDSLVQNFVYKDGIISGFVDTKALVANESKTTTFPYDYVNITVDGSLEGVMSFNQGERTKYLTITYSSSGNSEGSYDYVIIDFTTTDQATIDAVRSAYVVLDKKMYDVDGNVIGTWDTSKLEVGGIFDVENEIADGVYCGIDTITGEERGLALIGFDSDLSSLTHGGAMFLNSNISSFTSDLSSLIDGTIMFEYCENLTSFTTDLSSLTNGFCMFAVSHLNSFISDLSSLTNGYGMFILSRLNSFSSDLSSLTNGTQMFFCCYYLTSFSSNLSSLTNGEEMFYGCKLDSASVKNIIDTINIVSSGELTLGVGCETSWMTNGYFFEEIGYSGAVDLGTAFMAKGWTVNFQYNGSSTSTYSMRGTTEPSLPVFVKLIEVEESSHKLKSFHTYTSLDGSKKYKLNWFHETTGSTEGYTQYATLEEAVEALNIKPIESI